MFNDNPNFYPTPPDLAERMLDKIKVKMVKVLEPSAGKGDLIDAFKKRYSSHHYNGPDVYAIEIDPTLQATLRGKKYPLLDTDFLNYVGDDKFDLIIGNPPFVNGDKHLLKALDILYRGQIVMLINAETLRNPFSNDRKLLVRRLEQAGAEIEYIRGAFKSAERPTGVEVALVNVVADRKVEDDLFADCDQHGTRAFQSVADKNELSTGRTVDELVAEYNQVVSVGTETIIGYFRNYSKVGKFLRLNDVGVGDGHKIYRTYTSEDLTTMMQATINDLLRSVRTDFWRRTLDLKEVRSRLTKKKQDEFEHAISERCHMDFTFNNITQFILNLLSIEHKTMTDAVLDIFDMFTVRHCYHGDQFEKNIWYFNGWKRNSAFACNKRVVIPVYGSYGGAFFDNTFNRWQLNHEAARTLRDIDLVLSYIDGGRAYTSISDVLSTAFSNGQSSGLESTYFKLRAHKKNTLHLEFKNQDLLRRFNVIACRGKNWLPGDFGSKAYDQLTIEEKICVDSFEGKESYEKHVNQPLFGGGGSPLAQLAMVTSYNESREFVEAA